MPQFAIRLEAACPSPAQVPAPVVAISSACPAPLQVADTRWELRFANLQEKDEVIAYAKKQGYRFGSEVDSSDLGLGWNELQDKLYSFPVEWAGKQRPGRPCELITVVRLRLLLKAFPRRTRRKALVIAIA